MDAKGEYRPGALDLLDFTVVDTSLDINRGMWMQKVSRVSLDLLVPTVVDTSLDRNRGMWKQNVSIEALDSTSSGHFVRYKPWNVEAKSGFRALDRLWWALR